MNDSFELEIKELIVNALVLNDIKPEQVDSVAPLFGAGGAGGAGLGLDSIDALELAMAIGKRYQVKFNSDDRQNRDTFGNVRNLAAYVARMRPDAAIKETP
jgi:acyl carrier protein